MALPALWSTLETELKTLEHEFINFVTNKPNITSAGSFTLKDVALLEGLLSRVWQTWGEFCRSCLMQSCLGAVNANGNTVPPVVAGNEATVSGAALHIKGKRNGSCWSAPANLILRYEPTWGDTGVLSNYITALNPSNRLQLQLGFSTAHTFSKAIQIIRNAAAHTNPQTMAEVNMLQSAYIAYSITDPVQSLFWVHHASSDFLITTAIDELIDGALIAIQ